MAISMDKEQTYHLLTRGNSSSEMLEDGEDTQDQGFLQSSHTQELDRHGKKSFFRRQIEFVKTNWQFVIILTMLQSIMGMLTMGKFFPAKENGSSVECLCRDGRPSLIPDLEYETRPEWWPTHMRELPHPWNLPPGDELDAAWDNLLWPAMIQLSEHELSSINGLPKDGSNRVRVENSGEYLAVLSAFHNLHCLNDIRKGLAWDEYYKNHSPEKDYAHEFVGYGHHAHCLNAIREYIMCRPDVNIVYTYEWAEGEPDHFNMTAVTDTQTTCVKWDSIDRWLRPRDLHPPYPFAEPAWLKKAKGEM